MYEFSHIRWGKNSVRIYPARGEFSIFYILVPTAKPLPPPCKIDGGLTFAKYSNSAGSLHKFFSKISEGASQGISLNYRQNRCKYWAVCKKNSSESLIILLRRIGTGLLYLTPVFCKIFNYLSTLSTYISEKGMYRYTQKYVFY